MILAYTTPHGWSMGAMIAYAAITNTMLMSIYSMNNMPYAALGGVMTGDVVERAKLNSFRFIAVNAAQFIVGGFTLPLVAKLAAKHAAGATVGIADKQYGWQMTMTIWAVLCLVLFLITFSTTKERIKPINKEKSSPKQDFVNLLKNNPWKVMFFMTLCHFCILSFRGGALYNYYHHYADKAAMYDWVQKLGLVVPAGAHSFRHFWKRSATSSTATGRIWPTQTWPTCSTASSTCSAPASPSSSFCCRRRWRKNLARKPWPSPALRCRRCAVRWRFICCQPTNVWGMVALTVLVAMVYAPTIPLIWAIYADVADYSEWKTGRRFTGMVFATIGFGLKAGLALGSASFLWIMAGIFNYDTKLPDAAEAVQGYRACSGIVVGSAFCHLHRVVDRLPNHQTPDHPDGR